MTDTSRGGVGTARSGTLPENQVRAMFDRIAGVYDLMNSVMTVGMHHRWRERAAGMARVGPGDRVLDVATGTGLVARELVARYGCSVVGADQSAGMLAEARRHENGQIAFVEASADGGSVVRTTRSTDE